MSNLLSPDEQLELVQAAMDSHVLLGDSNRVHSTAPDKHFKERGAVIQKAYRTLKPVV